MAWNNLRNFLAGGTRARELRETRELYDRVRHAFSASPYTDDAFGDFRVDLLIDACGRSQRVPISPLINAFGRLIGDLVDLDFLLYGFPNEPNLTALTAHEAVDLRTYLRRKERFLADPERQHTLWREKVANTIAGVIDRLPPTLFKGNWDENDPEPDDGQTVPLIDLLENPAETIERLFGTYNTDDLLQAEMFSELREQFDRRVCAASGIEWAERHTTKRRVVRPSEWKPEQPAALLEAYLDGTPFGTLLAAPMPFSIPFPVRFEHTHIVGGSGHGKTQLLQLGVLRDLEAAISDGRSVVVIDSQGDLIRAVARLAMFAPGHPSGLSEKLLLVDPTDIEYPVALNMFDFDRGGLDRLPPLERERLLNATIDLYEYFFGALLGAELTARQGIIFKYIARLLVEVPDATIHTFRELMEDGEPFRPFMAKLPPTSSVFFETRFFDRTFNETKKQVLTRLWGVLSNATFDRMFSYPRSKVDMFRAMQDGKIVLVNTAKELLGHEGASILGRFFIALIGQATQRRAVLPPHERNPAFVYIDEAADYFDTSIDHLLNQARKYKVAMVLAHQNLDQLAPGLRGSVFSSTSIKYAGGVSSKDAGALASEMRSDADFLMAMRKRERETTFACSVRNLTPRALAVSVPLGTLEREEQMDDSDWDIVRDRIRSEYCIPAAEVPPPSVRVVKTSRREDGRPARAPAERKTAHRPSGEAEPEPIEPPPAVAEAEDIAPSPPPLRRRPSRIDPDDPPSMGRGGREHTYLQNLIKEFALSKGFKATIEEPILGGAGRVDVALSHGTLRIACEISVTTGRDHELGNIEKCVAAGFNSVIFVCRDARHRTAMARATKASLEDAGHEKVRFFDPEGALAYIASLAPVQGEATIRGYKVKVSHVVSDEADMAKRRTAIAAVIAKSVKKTGK